MSFTKFSFRQVTFDEIKKAKGNLKHDEAACGEVLLKY